MPQRTATDTESTPGTKLFVGSFPYATTLEELKDLFAPHGEITEAFIVPDRDTGKSRGFGFLTLRERGAAWRALAQLNGRVFQGRALKVDKAVAPGI